MLVNGLRSTSRLSGVVSRSYHSTIVSSPPTVKISTPELVGSFFLFAGSLLIWPMYMVPNFKNFAKPKSG